MASPTLSRLLKRLRELRDARGLTQEGLAAAANMSYKYYQAIESGRKKDLRLSTLERLARAHGLAVHQLLAPNPGSKLGKRRPAGVRRVRS